MAENISGLHNGLDDIAWQKLEKTADYSVVLNSLSTSDVLNYYIQSEIFIVRPSETEPKLKAYISVTAQDKTETKKMEEVVNAALAAKMK